MWANKGPTLLEDRPDKDPGCNPLRSSAQPPVKKPGRPARTQSRSSAFKGGGPRGKIVLTHTFLDKSTPKFLALAKLPPFLTEKTEPKWMSAWRNALGQNCALRVRQLRNLSFSLISQTSVRRRLKPGAALARAVNLVSISQNVARESTPWPDYSG